MFDLLVGLANDQGSMEDHSHEEQALKRIQHEWAAARVKGDSSYTRRIESEDCTIVWPRGSLANKRADLKSMTDVMFSEFKIEDLQVRLYGDTGSVAGEGMLEARKANPGSYRRKIRLDRHICEAGRRMEIVASQITQVVEK